jgi:hypothetical protein
MASRSEHGDQAEPPPRPDSILTLEGNASNQNLSTVEGDRNSECSESFPFERAEDTKEYDTQRGLRNRRTKWQTPAAIIGFYFTGTRLFLAR